MEDPAVFERVHAYVFELVKRGCIDGLRIDHVDGLFDPGDYLRTFQQAVPAALAAALDALIAEGAVGNVTIPHKETVAARCVELTPLAARVGVVNTFWVDPRGRLLGDNTDVGGFEAGARAALGERAQEREHVRHGVRAGERRRPARALEGEAEREQRAEDVGVRVDVAEEQHPAAARGQRVDQRGEDVEQLSKSLPKDLTYLHRPASLEDVFLKLTGRDLRD